MSTTKEQPPSFGHKIKQNFNKSTTVLEKNWELKNWENASLHQI